uniref:Uncharacterized protein n=1 Tax=Candidatus Kentrum sp. LPFa TaxID=2126335 RepID=A0A450X604_9GAMM|nr:MAG: hypothetical protein BECKLPF1236C_GA0070990_1001523 [Candidatus Kentron sp. LPFa]
MVYDTDPEKMIAAQQKGYNVQAACVEDIVGRCNVILVGCDTAPITPPMYDRMHDRTILATVTSPDDAMAASPAPPRRPLAGRVTSPHRTGARAGSALLGDNRPTAARRRPTRSSVGKMANRTG